jgi:hypothetical protein
VPAAAPPPLTQTWIPKESGKGGHYTNSTYHDNVPDSTFSLVGATVKYNSWRPLPEQANYGSAQSGNITTLDIFNRYVGNSQTLTSSVIAGITNDGASKSKVVNMTTNAVIRSSASAQPTTGTGRYVFASVKNRLYMANGTDVPVISPDATASSCIPWGKNPQSQNLAYQIGAPGTGLNAYVAGGTQGTCTVTNSGTTNNVAWVSGPNFQYFKTGQVIYINGVYATILTVPSSTTMTLLNNGTPVVANGVGVPFSYAPTGISTGAAGSVTVTGAGGVQATGTVTGTTTLTWNTGVNFAGVTVGSTIYLGGTANTVASITSVTVLTLGTPVGNASYNLSYGTVAGGSTVFGSTALTSWTGFGAGTPSLNPLSGTFIPPGSPIFISTGAGALPITPTVQYAITPGSATAGTLATTYAEATGGSPVTRSAQVNFGPISFQNASYTYAVSYWNFTSGHVTNPSTVLSVKDGAPNNVNVTVTISNIITTNDSAYNYIILWRSQAGNASLQPLAILNNDTGNVGNGTITYTDTLGDDTALGTCLAPGQSTGPGKIVAPANGTNAPPPSDLNFPVYWDGRFWASSQTQIGLLFFSARSTFGASTTLGANEDINCGVAEECWPPIFTRPIPDADGKITGLRVVGGTLMVLTDKAIYAVYGSNQTNYGLSKVSSKGAGTSHFATCVIPGEDVNASDVLVHFGNDGRLYFLFGSGGDFPVSYPIQPDLEVAGASAATATVFTMHNSTSTYVGLVPVPGGTLYLYDLERKIWIKSGFSAYGTGVVEGLLNGALTYLFSDYNFGNNVYYGNQAIGTPAVGYTILTNWTTFGKDKKDDKLLASVTVYTNDPAANIQCFVSVDGGFGFQMTQVPSTGTYGPAFHEFADAIVFEPQGGPFRGRLFQFQVQNTAPTAYTSSIYEITAKASYSQDPPKQGANL